MHMVLWIISPQFNIELLCTCVCVYESVWGDRERRQHAVSLAEGYSWIVTVNLFLICKHSLSSLRRKWLTLNFAECVVVPDGFWTSTNLFSTEKGSEMEKKQKTKADWKIKGQRERYIPTSCLSTELFAEKTNRHCLQENVQREDTDMRLHTGCFTVQHMTPRMQVQRCHSQVCKEFLVLTPPPHFQCYYVLSGNVFKETSQCWTFSITSFPP